MLLRSEPESAKKLHIIDKTISSISKDIETVIRKKKMSSDEKWSILKHKLGNYFDLLSSLRTPVDDDDDDEVSKLRPLAIKSDKETSPTQFEPEPSRGRKKTQKSVKKSRSPTNPFAGRLRSRKQKSKTPKKKEEEEEEELNWDTL